MYIYQPLSQPGGHEQIWLFGVVPARVGPRLRHGQKCEGVSFGLDFVAVDENCFLIERACGRGRLPFSRWGVEYAWRDRASMLPPGCGL
jgi:hypothetical protein